MGKFLVRTGRFIQSLAVVVMRPRDLIEFTRLTYAHPRDIQGWADRDLVDSGLTPAEESLLKKVPLAGGRVLVLGSGGGREAIVLARRGFKVTGIDFVPGMVESAVANARDRGVEIDGLVQDITMLNVPERSFDIVWLTAGLYSLVPTRKLRVTLLKRIGSTLREGGYCICGFYRSGDRRPTSQGAILRKIVQYVTLGNFHYEKGDILLANIEFAHAFSSEDELREEFSRAGFDVLYLYFPREMGRGEAVLRPIGFGDAGTGAG
jgi:SAM-dependent methyltransferase